MKSFCRAKTYLEEGGGGFVTVPGAMPGAGAVGLSTVTVGLPVETPLDEGIPVESALIVGDVEAGESGEMVGG